MTHCAPEGRRPRVNQIMAEPAAVDMGQADYLRSAAVRAAAFKEMRQAGASGRA